MKLQFPDINLWLQFGGPVPKPHWWIMMPEDKLDIIYRLFDKNPNLTEIRTKCKCKNIPQKDVIMINDTCAHFAFDFQGIDAFSIDIDTFAADRFSEQHPIFLKAIREQNIIIVPNSDTISFTAVFHNWEKYRSAVSNPISTRDLYYHKGLASKRLEHYPPEQDLWELVR